MEVPKLAGRARWAVIALVAVVITDLVAAWSDWLEIDLTNRILDGEDVPLDDLEANDDRQAVVGVLQLLMFIVAAFFFIRWFHRAYSNLLELGQPDLRHGPGWAIGSWFVPILNLWRPKQIANDIWRGSGPKTPKLVGDAAWKDSPVPALLTAWWLLWILTSVVGNVAGRLWWNADTIESTRNAARFDLATYVVDIPAAVLAILVVRRLTERQEARARERATQAVEPPPPATMT